MTSENGRYCVDFLVFFSSVEIALRQPLNNDNCRCVEDISIVSLRHAITKHFTAIQNTRYTR